MLRDGTCCICIGCVEVCRSGDGEGRIGLATGLPAVEASSEAMLGARESRFGIVMGELAAALSSDADT